MSVKIEENDRTTVGQSSDTDTLVASANAYLNALNKMIIKRKKTAPDVVQQQKHYKQQKMKAYEKLLVTSVDDPIRRLVIDSSTLLPAE